MISNKRKGPAETSDQLEKKVVYDRKFGPTCFRNNYYRIKSAMTGLMYRNSKGTDFGSWKDWIPDLNEAMNLHGPDYLVFRHSNDKSNVFKLEVHRKNRREDTFMVLYAYKDLILHLTAKVIDNHFIIDGPEFHMELEPINVDSASTLMVSKAADEAHRIASAMTSILELIQQQMEAVYSSAVLTAIETTQEQLWTMKYMVDGLTLLFEISRLPTVFITRDSVIAQDNSFVNARAKLWMPHNKTDIPSFIVESGDVESVIDEAVRHLKKK
jgi:hypothetical protein